MFEPPVAVGAVVRRAVRRWPAPAGAATPAVLAAALLTGLVAAFCLPARPGLGWPVTVLTATAALLATRTTRSIAESAGRAAATTRSTAEGAARAATTTRPTVEGAGRAAATTRSAAEGAGWGVATVLLAGVGAVRAAGWLFALCLLAATVTASLALTRGTGAYAVAVRAVALAAGTIRVPRWAGTGAAALGRPDRAAVLRRAATAAVTVALLVVFGALLVSADPDFAEVVGRLLPDGTAPVGRFLVLVAGAGVLLAAAAVRAAPPDVTGGGPPTRRLRREEWLLPAAALVGLFAAFLLVRAAVLFGGRTHVLGAGGPTYAGYARGGFWQLLAVTALTLAILGAAARWVPRESPADRTLVRAVLGTLTVLTLVIVVSALSRMQAYEQAYGFTRLRLLVSVAELWLGVVLVLVLVAGVRLRARRLPELVVATAVLALLGLAALDPDRFIAARNVERYATTQDIDLGYLSRLSADAIPALDRLPADVRACALPRDPGPDGPRAWNLGRSRARDVLARGPAASCRSASGR